MYVLIVLDNEDVTPGVHGPFSTVTDAQAYAERFRARNFLPVEATSENNEAWTDEGWYFGIFEPTRINF
jgi:hypothetical protein